MKRFILNELNKWKTSISRKPLIIRGARQVGKTWTVKHFGEISFNKNFHIIDFEKRPDMYQIFEKNFDVKRIISELEIFMNTKIDISKDLIFFDEIQNCPKALKSMRYFYEDMPELHLIAAGSLLEFSFDTISFPVGRIKFLNMHPLTFAEFLLAQGKENLAEIIISEIQDLSDSIHNLLIDELRNFFFVGGMPESVLCYLNNQSLIDSLKVQNDLILTYQEDFAKYHPKVDKLCLNQVLISVAQKVGFQIKYSKLTENFSNPTISKAFHLLHKAQLLTQIQSANPSGTPLGASASNKIFKAIILDIGLQNVLCRLSLQNEYTRNLLNIYSGSLAEQFVGQELRANKNNNLYYWSRQSKSSNAEVDFLIEKNGKIYPIEVKSGATGTLKSMHMLLDKYKNCPKGIIFSTKKYSQITEKKLEFIPIYYAYQFGLEDKIFF